MNMREVEDEGLEREIELFFASAHRYREYLKKNHPDRLFGVIIARHGNDCILFSESQRYTTQICNLLWDRDSDAFNAIKQVAE